MFFNKRKKWNSQVASFLPTFDLTIEIVGASSALEVLDLVYPKGFSGEEGALYLAYLSYSTFLKEKDSRAKNLRERMDFAEKIWIEAKRVNPKIVAAWREKAKVWERTYS